MLHRDRHGGRACRRAGPDEADCARPVHAVPHGRNVHGRAARRQLAPAPGPSPAADFALEDAGPNTFKLVPQSTKAAVATVRFAPAQGCAEFPEADLNSTGTETRGETEYGRVRGVLEGHMHWMAYDYFGGHFRCGRPWHEYGITAALPDCSDNEGPQGTAAPLQNLLSFGNPGRRTARRTSPASRTSPRTT